MKKEWTLEEIRDFDKKQFQSVSARIVRCLLAYYDEYKKLHPPTICDGCNVNGNHEHRCHGNNIQIKGEPTDKKCECDFLTCKMIQH